MTDERIALLHDEGRGEVRLISEFIYFNVLHDEANRRKLLSGIVRRDFIMSEVFSTLCSVEDGVIADMVELACNRNEKKEGRLNKAAVAKMMNS